MIQRIQTLYLMLAIVCCIVMCFSSPLFFEAPDATFYSMDFRHLHHVVLATDGQLVHAPNGAVMDIWGLSVIPVIVAVLCLVDIFLFKKRILQARINIFTVCACVGYYAMLFMYAWFAKQRFSADWSIEWTASMPLVAMVLVMMATRKILADEALVRSADRLR